MPARRKAFLGAAATLLLAEQGASLYVDTWTKGSGYTGTAVSGIAYISDWVADSSGTAALNIWFKLADLPACTANDSVDGSCKIGIKDGTSCSDVGSTYYKSSSNPWEDTGYNAGTMEGENNIVYAGLSLSDITGKVIVINNAAAAFIACGVIQEHPTKGSAVKSFEGTFGTYPSYEGDYNTSGSVTVTAVDETLDGLKGYTVVEFDAEGLDPRCTGEAELTAGNACGVHVHTGTCTSTSTVGGHYYTGTSDPWAKVIYAITTTSEAKSALMTVPVAIGAVDLAGRSIVMHDKDGGRIACADLEEATGAVSGGIAQIPGVLGFFTAMIALSWGL